MFNPSQHDVRRFFCETYRKSMSGEILTPMETIAAHWISLHPEYHDLLSHLDKALNADFSVEKGQTNPFLHLSMHLSISEQISINQPVGIRDAFIALAKLRGDEHAAHHEIMECLGEMLWQSQRTGLPPDGEAYINNIRRRLQQP